MQVLQAVLPPKVEHKTAVLVWWRRGVGLDKFMITASCWIDDILESLYQGRPLRQRGPKSALFDTEVRNINWVGEYMGFSQDQDLFR